MSALKLFAKTVAITSGVTVGLYVTGRVLPAVDNVVNIGAKKVKDLFKKSEIKEAVQEAAGAAKEAVHDAAETVAAATAAPAPSKPIDDAMDLVREAEAELRNAAVKDEAGSKNLRDAIDGMRLQEEAPAAEHSVSKHDRRATDHVSPIVGAGGKPIVPEAKDDHAK